jgi:anthranilate phosphoribosyltransferase
VVHGAGGLDELSLAGENFLCEVAGGSVHSYTLQPEEVGLPYCPVERLKGGNAQENAGIFRAVLRGEKGPCRDVVLLNAGAALYVAGRAGTIRDGVKLAAELIDSGAALAKMEAFAGFSRRGSHRGSHGGQAICI